MAQLHFAHREIVAKVVYFGAPGAGSNTNVRTLYGLLAYKERSRLHQFQSWYFDYVPAGALVPGFATRLRVYSMPGGIRNASHREQVFGDVDALVLVADARTARAQGNRLAAEELLAFVKQHGRNLQALPLVIQVNHTDAPDARTADTCVAELGLASENVIPAVARQSQGVLETHDALVGEVCRRLCENLGGATETIQLAAALRENVEKDEEIVARHMAGIEAAERDSRPSLEHNVGDFQVALTRRYQALTHGPRVELGFQPKEFFGMRPVHLMDTRIEADTIVVDVVMERNSGGEPRRLALILANRPTDATPVQRMTAPSIARGGVTENLPDSVDMLPPDPWDFPPVWYGIAGIAGGTLVGMLVGFLMFS
jgi:signal recognition particle receptor subunit beta